MERDGSNELSASSFNSIVAATIIFGLVMFGWSSGIMYRLSQSRRLNGWVLLALVIGAFVGCVASSQRNPRASCLGLFILASSLGGVSGPVFGQYKIASISDIAFATVVTTLSFGAVGTIYPKSLTHWRGLLCTALISLVFAEFVGLFVTSATLPEGGFHPVFSWCGLALFSGYILYDFNRAQSVTRTTQNAIQIGVAVFLDMINIFLGLLRLFGSKRDPPQE